MVLQINIKHYRIFADEFRCYGDYSIANLVRFRNSTDSLTGKLTALNTEYDYAYAVRVRYKNSSDGLTGDLTAD